MKDKLYVVLYYLSFLLTIGIIWYSSTFIDFFGGVNLIPYVVLLVINILSVIVFTIRLIINRKTDNTLIAFPISYMLFVIIVYILGFVFDSRMIIPKIEYSYFNLFIEIDYLLLNIYSLLCIEKRKSKRKK